MTDPITLRPVFLARIEDNPNIRIVPIGARVPKILKLWINRDAALLLAQDGLQALFTMPHDDRDACVLLGLPVMVVRAGEEPAMEPTGKIIRPDAIIPDIGRDG